MPIAEGFQRAGIALLQGYGLTESSPVISFNTLEHHRIGTVGQPVPGVEVRIANDGEVLTRGPHVMRGYWMDPELTAHRFRPGPLPGERLCYSGDPGLLVCKQWYTENGSCCDVPRTDEPCQYVKTP